jgi:beta-1,4-mannosyl-glycoprotein beta-1,4-N-acetylglucosaminyltransferase
MIIDCFPFFNELDILELRLNILNDCVDKFVLVEASKTQSLLDKPFYFEENKERFKPFLDKIVHVKVEDHPSVGGWAMENFQRNRISIGCESLNLQDEDIIAISDLDEIWNPNIAPHLQEFLDKYNCVSEAMRYFVFYLNLETVDKGWIGTVFCHHRNFNKVILKKKVKRKKNIHLFIFPV